MDKKLDEHDELLLELRNGQQNLTATQHGILGTLELLLEHNNVMDCGQARGCPTGSTQSNTCSYPKWELPSFEGLNSKVWVPKCERYFNLYRIDDAKKVDGATLYLNGDAEI
ncbi:hypothetical protein KY289_026580 [Solanum tuberosum]|nr:hypothetical protein KY289_026580 [Solanum tuberosum]